MKTLTAKILEIMTSKNIVVAKDPYNGKYCIHIYPQQDALSIEFPSHGDAVCAQSVLAKEFDWFDIHELDSFKEPRWILVAKLGSPHQGTQIVH